MAVDTRDKRMSMLGLGSCFVRLLKNPAGVVNAAAREMLLFLYSGIALPAPAAGTPRLLYALSSRGNQIDVLSRTGNGIRALSRN